MQNNPVKEERVVANAATLQQARPARWFIAALATFLPLFFGAWVLIAIGGGVQNFSVRDNLFWLNSGWRILHGQIPHTDFSLPVGTLLGYLAALGMQIRGPSAASIAAGQAVFGLGIAAISFLVLRRRTTPLLAALGALFSGLLIMALRQAGEPYNLHSNAFLYNRIAEGMLAPFTWLALMLPRDRHARNHPLEHLTAGFLLALLTFTKVTYGMIGVAILLLALLANRLRLRDCAWIIAAALLGGALIATITGISPSAWWTDISTPFRIGYDGSRTGRLFACVIKGLPSLFVLGVLGGMAFNYITAKQRQLLFIVIVGIWALAIFDALASNQRQEYLLPISIALILTDGFYRRLSAASPRRIISLALFLLLAASTLLPDARSIASTWAGRHQATPSETVMDAPGLRDFRLSPNQITYAAELNEALALAATVPGDTPVLAVDYSDGLAFALHRTPPAGGAIFWYPGFSYAPKAHPAPELIFRGSPWILITRNGRERGLFMDIYGAQLSNLYERAAASPDFDLWAPRNAP